MTDDTLEDAVSARLDSDELENQRRRRDRRQAIVRDTTPGSPDDDDAA